VSQTFSLVPPYALAEELHQTLDIPTEDTSKDVDLQRALDAARQWIDWFTGRTFGLSATGTARVYAAAAEDLVTFTDLQDTAPTVAVDTAGDRTYATTLVPAQYLLTPTSGPPFSALRAWPTPAGGAAAPKPIVFEPGQLVRITGRWGYVDARGRLPAAVNEACLLLGARWTKRREAPFGVLQSQQLDVFQNVPPVDPDVQQLLFPLSAPGSPGAALLAATAPAAGAPAGAASWVLV